MTDLSPAAQAVLAAYHEEAWAVFRYKLGLAAALRALADQVVPHQSEPACVEDESWPPIHQLMIDARWEQRQQTRSEILAIADELEGDNEPTFTPEEIEMIQAPWSYLQSQEEIKNE